MSISKDWPSLMESLEMRNARFSKLIDYRKEKFENKGRFPISSGQLQIQEGVFSGWEHCHIQKSVLEPRKDGGHFEHYIFPLFLERKMGNFCENSKRVLVVEWFRYLGICPPPSLGSRTPFWM